MCLKIDKTLIGMGVTTGDVPTQRVSALMRLKHKKFPQMSVRTRAHTHTHTHTHTHSDTDRQTHTHTHSLTNKHLAKFRRAKSFKCSISAMWELMKNTQKRGAQQMPSWKKKITTLYWRNLFETGEVSALIRLTVEPCLGAGPILKSVTLHLTPDECCHYWLWRKWGKESQNAHLHGQKPKSKKPGFFVVPFTLPEKPITFGGAWHEKRMREKTRISYIVLVFW